MKILLASIIALSSVTPAMAHHSQAGYSSSRDCYKTVYREEYIPGTKANPGYIKTYNETVAIPCRRKQKTTVIQQQQVQHDNNDCTDGKVAGAILGGGAAAAMSRGDGRWWAIPLGVVAGSAIGCDAAGG